MNVTKFEFLKYNLMKFFGNIVKGEKEEILLQIDWFWWKFSTIDDYSIIRLQDRNNENYKIKISDRY